MAISGKMYFITEASIYVQYRNSRNFFTIIRISKFLAYDLASPNLVMYYVDSSEPTVNITHTSDVTLSMHDELSLNVVYFYTAM